MRWLWHVPWQRKTLGNSCLDNPCAAEFSAPWHTPRLSVNSNPPEKCWWAAPRDVQRECVVLTAWKGRAGGNPSTARHRGLSCSPGLSWYPEFTSVLGYPQPWVFLQPWDILKSWVILSPGYSQPWVIPSSVLSSALGYPKILGYPELLGYSRPWVIPSPGFSCSPGLSWNPEFSSILCYS